MKGKWIPIVIADTEIKVCKGIMMIISITSIAAR